jgi:hypothetical protein
MKFCAPLVFFFLFMSMAGGGWAVFWYSLPSPYLFDLALVMVESNLFHPHRRGVWRNVFFSRLSSSPPPFSPHAPPLSFNSLFIAPDKRTRSGGGGAYFSGGGEKSSEDAAIARGGQRMARG